MDATKGESAAMVGLFERQAATWNAGDAAGYAACFTLDAEYVTWVGTRYRGRADIERSHAALFRRFLRGTTMRWEIVSVRTLAGGTAVVLTRGDVAKPRPRRLTKVQTYVVVDSPEGLQVGSFHNTRRRPLIESLSFRAAPQTRPAG
jgi:uncharacterized protein (TIGR02246 family)